MYKIDVANRYLSAVRGIYSPDDLGGKEFLLSVCNSLKSSGIDKFLKSRSIPKSIISLFKEYIYGLKSNKLNIVYDFFDSNNRLNIFQDILFLVAKSASDNFNKVRVVSVSPLKNDELENIKKTLLKLLGNVEYDLEQSIDSRLIAGYKIYYKGRCLDLSHRSRIMKVKNILQDNLLNLKLENF